MSDERQIIRPQADRFWSKVTKGQKCWLWTAGRNKKGYGGYLYDGKQWRVHRLAWHLTNGPIPDGLQVCHRCDVRLCCRPDHLFLGTAQENSDDMVAKGRSRAGLGVVLQLIQQRKTLAAELASLDDRIAGLLATIAKRARAKMLKAPVSEIEENLPDIGDASGEPADAV